MAEQVEQVFKENFLNTDFSTESPKKYFKNNTTNTVEKILQNNQFLPGLLRVFTFLFFELRSSWKLSSVPMCSGITPGVSGLIPLLWKYSRWGELQIKKVKLMG